MMKIFLCHASEDKAIAEPVQLALANAGHEVFYDENSLPAGSDYHKRIHKAIKQSDLFIFLVSKNSIKPGKYTLSELAFAREKWPNPVNNVLAVNIAAVITGDVPSYLAATTILTVKGNPAAEVRAAANAIFDQRNSGGKKYLSVGIAIVSVAIVIALVIAILSNKNSKLLVLQEEAIKEVRALDKKIVVNMNKKSDISESKLSELVSFYKFRAEVVRSTLEKRIEFAPVSEYLNVFNNLHEQHLSALKDGHLVLAAEVLRQIHTLSRNLDRDEFSISHQIERPNVAYSMCTDAFTRGLLLEAYSGSLVSETLAVQAGVYPDCQDYSLTPEEVEKSAKPEYLYGVLAVGREKPD